MCGSLPEKQLYLPKRTEIDTLGHRPMNGGGEMRCEVSPGSQQANNRRKHNRGRWQLEEKRRCPGINQASSCGTQTTEGHYFRVLRVPYLQEMADSG